ncbi:GIY-YIG nuclease family protein [Algoriphagus litoralis]|uniref:GIY-YIG nuclease family protein n=1 Tax=Algoriphagus litoralis TaxID=2202829 RepID=UPI000DBA1C0B|nr:GIY-YIG nuclease family protein [Algoriphagus litoralis]
MKTYFVYILKCSDKSYYTGVTNDFEGRIAAHNDGLDPHAYTFKRRPVELVFLQDFREIQEAIAFEKQVKGWSRKKKEAIIQNNWQQLKFLSECKNHTSHKNFEKNSSANQLENGVE